MIGALLAEMLSDMGYAVCAVAATEEEAVASAMLHKPGLMIVDEQLREGSGLNAVGRILRMGVVPCIFMSAAPVYPPDPGRLVLRKPFLEADLILAVRRTVGPAAMSLPARPDAASPSDPAVCGCVAKAGYIPNL